MKATLEILILTAGIASVLCATGWLLIRTWTAFGDAVAIDSGRIAVTVGIVRIVVLVVVLASLLFSTSRKQLDR